MRRIHFRHMFTSKDLQNSEFIRFATSGFQTTSHVSRPALSSDDDEGWSEDDDDLKSTDETQRGGATYAQQGSIVAQRSVEPRHTTSRSVEMDCNGGRFEAFAICFGCHPHVPNFRRKRLPTVCFVYAGTIGWTKRRRLAMTFSIRKQARFRLAVFRL